MSEDGRVVDVSTFALPDPALVQAVSVDKTRPALCRVHYTTAVKKVGDGLGHFIASDGVMLAAVRAWDGDMYSGLEGHEHLSIDPAAIKSAGGTWPSLQRVGLEVAEGKALGDVHGPWLSDKVRGFVDGAAYLANVDLEPIRRMATRLYPGPMRKVGGLGTDKDVMVDIWRDRHDDALVGVRFEHSAGVFEYEPPIGCMLRSPRLPEPGGPLWLKMGELNGREPALHASLSRLCRLAEALCRQPGQHLTLTRGRAKVQTMRVDLYLTGVSEGESRAYTYSPVLVVPSAPHEKVLEVGELLDVTFGVLMPYFVESNRKHLAAVSDWWEGFDNE